MKKEILVIGAGASGMTAAIEAARHGCTVTIIEKNEKAGKKLLATGNGKCNFTNEHMADDCFYGTFEEVRQQILAAFTKEDTVMLMRSLGIEPVEKNGYYYPASGQAASVVEVFLMECRRLGISILTGYEAISIQKKKKQFFIELLSKEDKIIKKADSIILSCGSCAGISPAKAKSAGYGLAKQLGHTIIPLVPALTGICCKETWLKEWAGVRIEGKVSLYTAESATSAKEEWKLLAWNQGELQLTEYGISGIPVFQVCRHAAYALRDNKRVKAVLDLYPAKQYEEVLFLLQQRRRNMPYKSMEELLVGLLPSKLIPIVLRLAEYGKTDRSEEHVLKKLAGVLKQITVSAKAIRPMEQAQVSAGGVCLSEINPKTMESFLMSGIYLTGEMLDVDGICGGYNLQWAWATGTIAGRSVAQ